MRRAMSMLTVAFAAVLVAVVTGAVVLYGQSEKLGRLAHANTVLIARNFQQTEHRRELRREQLAALHREAVRSCNAQHKLVMTLINITKGNVKHGSQPVSLLRHKLRLFHAADCVVVKALPTAVKKTSNHSR